MEKHQVKDKKVGEDKMAHCPYCGSKVNSDEQFCVECGKRLPDDIYDRFVLKPKKQRYVIFFLSIVTIALLSFVSYYFYLKHQEKTAIEWYQSAERQLQNEHYQEAHEQLKKALTHKSNFPSAEALYQFTDAVLSITDSISSIDDTDFEAQLLEINESKKIMSAYSGTAVEQFQDELSNIQSDIQLQHVEAKLNQDPNIQTLQTILWEAEGIQDKKADELVASIREQIIAYTSTEANNYLQTKQFSNARKVVDRGLQYVPDSEKLTSLKTTIDKEKTAFETAQEQRIAQALTAVELENEKNANDAVELDDIALEQNKQNEIVVSGELTSVATVPINTISVQYTIKKQDGEVMTTNEIYVYPETLYPDENGKFDHTHFDITADPESLDVSIDSIKWFLD